MDQQRFDSVTRMLGAGRSRRQVMKAMAGGAIALTAVEHASAQTCGVLGDECDIVNENADCCNGLVCFEAICDNPSGLCMAEDEYCGSNDFECCEGLDCVSDYCATVASLPDTGAGRASGKNSLLSLGLIGSVAAFLASKTVRRSSVDVEC